MSSVTMSGLLVRRPTELKPRAGFTTSAQLISVLDEEAGEVFHLVADDEAAAALASAETPCRVTLGLRASSVSLGSLTGGSVKGRAYRFKVLTASLETGRSR